jgi:glucose/arabinose dehydrogenase
LVLRPPACCAILILAAACSGGGSGDAATGAPASATPGGSHLTVQQVAGGLDQPVEVAALPGSDRLAVVEKTGRLILLPDGDGGATTLLDLRGRVATGSEQGLLSVAFDPHYAETHVAYVDYTDLAGNTHIARLDTRSHALRTLLLIRQPFANHNGGGLAFGPDGLLYIGMGDGGSEGDPQGNGQNRGTLLGKILRMDVTAARPQPHVYAYGLRNPWRISFDPATGDLWIGDVGQDSWEEIDRLPAGAAPGANLGWNAYEGRVVFRRQAIDRSRLVWPVAVYSHGLGCSVTGGVVYRGNDLGALDGSYVYGDYCSGRIWAIPAQGGRPRLLPLPRLPGLDSFGVDGAGRLYASTLGGRVLRIVTGR